MRLRAPRRPGVLLLVAVAALAALGVTADLTAPTAARTSAQAPDRPVTTGPAVPVAQADGVCPDPAADATTETRVSVAAPASARPATAWPRRLRPVVAPGCSGWAPAAAADRRGRVVRLGAGHRRRGPARRPGRARGRPRAGRRDAHPQHRRRGSRSAGHRVRHGGQRLLVRGQRVGGGTARAGLPERPGGRASRRRRHAVRPGRPDRRPGRPGVAVAAGAQEVALLDALAPGSAVLAVHVHTRTGRIAAAVRDQQIDGLTPVVPTGCPPPRRRPGASWLPASSVAPVNACSRWWRRESPTPSSSWQLLTDSGPSPRPGSTCSRSRPARSRQSTSRRTPAPTPSPSRWTPTCPSPPG